MPIIGTIASSTRQGLSTNSYESIATVTVGSGGASDITFSSIPGTYTHLQIRGISCGTRADYRIGEAEITFNSDTGANYACHDMYGNGSTVTTTGLSSRSNIRIAPGTLGGNAGGTAFFGAIIIDILDYANTNKYKTMRSLSGVDINGDYAGVAGRLGVTSGLWQNTNAITSIKFTPTGASPFVQYTTFALYGVKGVA